MGESLEFCNPRSLEIKKKEDDWNFFFFNLCLQLLSDKEIILKNFAERTFGSWIIQTNNIKLIYDGRDDFLLAEVKDNGNWIYKSGCHKDNLTFAELEQILTTTSY